MIVKHDRAATSIKMQLSEQFTVSSLLIILLIMEGIMASHEGLWLEN